MPVTKVLKLNSKTCKGCGICAAFCPKSVLAMVEGKAAVQNADACVSCGTCEMLCPDYSIYFETEESAE